MGEITPILANIYLHFALDLWFHKMVIPHCSGEACLIRYADDFVSAFEKEEDARRFYEGLGERLEKFKLEPSTKNTRITPFSPSGRKGKISFDFLGFEFRWGKDRSGKPHVDKRTALKSLRNSLTRFKLWLKENRHRRLPELFSRLNVKLKGYFNHFGVYGNIRNLEFFYYQVIRQLWKYLNRRSQRKSYNWDGFRQLLAQFGVVRPHIVYRPRRVRKAFVPGLV